mgnify:FL=1
MVECLRFPDGHPQALAVFNMAAKVADSGIEYIVKRVFSKKEVAYYSQRFSNFFVCP